MLPLLAESAPTTASELAKALERGLQREGLMARKIEAEGAAFPQIETLLLDLTNARMTREIRPPEAAENRGAALQIAQFELLGAPIYLENAPLELRLHAERVKARVEMSDDHGRLVLEGANAGNVSAEISREALEALLQSIASAAAAKQGFEVKKTALTFTQEGPRAVSFRAEVTAKVFIMSAALVLTGRVAIDDAFNAQISNLNLDGDGMILKLASGYARPYLDRLEGRLFPLLAFTAGELKLRDVRITAGSTLRVQAEFGAADLPIT